MASRHAIFIAAIVAGAALAAPALAHDHGHAPDAAREAPAGVPAPGLEVEATADPTDGFNLHLVTRNFTFSPERTGIATEAVEGHAHLYVNGVKVGRVYGPWVHLPDNLLAPGDNEVTVSLNDNRHSPWTAGGAPVEASLVLQGRREIAVEAGGEDVPVIEVAQGERIRLVITGAGEGALHFHGYDLEAEAVAGAPVTLDFSADHSGRFPVMAHVHDEILGERERALLYLEIRSR